MSLMKSMFSVHASLNWNNIALSCAFWSPAMGLEPEDRKRLLLVGDVEGGLAKLYSQVGWGTKTPKKFRQKKVFINQSTKTNFDIKS